MKAYMTHPAILRDFVGLGPLVPSEDARPLRYRGVAHAHRAPAGALLAVGRRLRYRGTAYIGSLPARARGPVAGQRRYRGVTY